ncbi:MAG TPA: hypothetical protein IAB28_10305 [Candidatus Copromonas faecavium]|uniref:Uncharacterized protein n=1 Tax=Candidatus Copromonas faecavium (nom. illeg.) TaxID=2840740 RepID=A0A9D1A672_9FIRM|nr:hypothetical protein [Candidatus Copromonas faecavium]
MNIENFIQVEKIGITIRPPRLCWPEKVLWNYSDSGSEEVYGIRTFWGLQQNQTQHAFEEWQHRMEELELRVAKIDEFRKIAFFHHLIFVKE